MRVCFAACLPGTAKLNFNSENGVQPSIRMETEPRIAYFITIIIYIYMCPISKREREIKIIERNFSSSGLFSRKREKKKEKEKEREEGENRTSRTKLASFRNAEGGELGGLV